MERGNGSGGIALLGDSMGKVGQQVSFCNLNESTCSNGNLNACYFVGYAESFVFQF